MLKHTMLAMTAVIGLASVALPLTITHAAAAACNLGCVNNPGGGNPPPGGGNPPPGGGNPPPGGGNPPNGGPPPDNKPAPDLPDDPNFNQDGTQKISMLISCRVPKGSDQTTAIVFRNIGQKTIPVGTPVTWYVSDTGQGGQFVLPGDLRVGQELNAADLLKLGVPADAHCLSKLV